jgi:hypothetical protein
VDGVQRVENSQTLDVDRVALASQARAAAADLARRGEMLGESAYAGPLPFEREA